jgi:tetratricopeptide (TPR) repeat protein
MRCAVHSEGRGWPAGALRGMVAVKRKLLLGAPLLMVVWTGCNSHEAAKTASSSPATPTTIISAQSSTQPAAQESQEKTITYATHPGQFAKESTYEPPFRITDPKTAEEHFDVGIHDDNRKEPSKAISEYEKVLALKPDWAVAHFRLARDYAQTGRTNEAITHWTKAIQYNPQFFGAYDQLAAAYVSQGNVQKAIDTYSGLLKYPRVEMPARYQLALWYEQLGKRKEAKQNFQRYQDLALQNGPEEKKSERFQVAQRELEKLNRQG